MFNAYIQEKSSQHGKAPEWAKQLKEIIQDQIDTNLNLSLKEVAAGLDMNPAYVSREFSKYFSDMSFGDYIRKLRIEKAIELLSNTSNSLAEIAYLTGFSDQSHFNRIFKQPPGKIRRLFEKLWLKSKLYTNGLFLFYFLGNWFDSIALSTTLFQKWKTKQ